ncbi:hypothetical protein DSN97_09170 [Deferribacteraceae bacterium V6Fe1]|nr:hypothetical protein DSN97_09170 [Deferribacteraceae bacterium V6Fe1]
MNASKMKVNEEKKVITWYEIVGIVVVFAISLYVLFPEKSIKYYVSKDSKNIQLTILYLESLVKLNPKNKDFKMLLLDYYVKNNMFDRATAFIKNLDEGSTLLNDYAFLLSSYQIYKNLYFADNKSSYRDLSKSFLIKLLSASKTLDEIDFIYQETINMDFQDLRFEALKSLLKLTKDKKYLSEFSDLYQQSLNHSDYDLALKTLDILYNLTNDTDWINKKIDILLNYQKDADSASVLLLELFEKTGNSSFFEKVLNILIWNKKTEKAAELLNKYTDYFIKINDTNMLTYFLKYYLSQGDVESARTLSLKILNGMNGI